MSFSANQLRDLSSLFSRSEVCRWLKKDFFSIDLKVSRYDIYDKQKGFSYLDFLRKAYEILEEYYPNEYIIKNEFLNQFLRKELVNGKAVIYNELRIGKVIADLSIFNGISKGFEIKTILDKDYRLSNQLQEYKKIFNEVYIIIPMVQLSKYIDYDNSVGIITYESSSKKFSLLRQAERRICIDVNVLMEVLHTKEYLKIVKCYYQELPVMNAFNQFDICKDLISKIPLYDLNLFFLEIMKARNIGNLFFNKKHSELNQICLSLSLKIDERNKLIENLKTKII